eukprot:6584124-Pyramimonas_sp.AAC.1
MDPEAALGVILGKVRQMCLLDGIKTDIQRTPRFSGPSAGAIGQAQQSIEGLTKQMQLELEA